MGVCCILWLAALFPMYHKGMRIPHARHVSNSFVKLFNFSCLFELFSLWRKKCLPRLWRSPCQQKSAKGKDYVVFCKTKRDVTFIYLPIEMKILWSSKLKNIRKKREKRCTVQLYSAVWGHFRLPQKIPSDSMLWRRPEARWTHG